jgi:2,3-dihydroxybiphenyl 1,2-dioxygenase
MDDRRQRIFIDREIGEGTRIFGWEVADGAALEALAARLDRAGVPVRWGAGSLADARHVAALISFEDPAGNRLEAFHGAHVDAAPFRPGRSISGFRTGTLGLGHAVLTARDIDAMRDFYTGMLGFRLSDFIEKPFRGYFLHVNRRHHSLALIEGAQDGMHHLMVELFSFDDIGQGYDIALAEQGRVATTLGRHTNDFVTSFYVGTPSAFMVEYGWGGREIDPATWQPFECADGPSLWGHERTWLSPEQRAQAQRMRMKAAESGVRQPLHVLAGNYHLMSGNCPWWDSIVDSNMPGPQLSPGE